MDTNENDKKQRASYGEGSIYMLSSNRWQVSFYDGNGIRRRESFKTEKKAQRRLDTLKALRDTGKLDPKESRTRIDDLAEAYKLYANNSTPRSADWIDLVWRVHLEPFFGGRLASRTTSDHLQEYIAMRLKAKAATSTVNRELAVLKAMFRKGLDADPPKVLRVPRFPDKLREPNPRSGFITEEQYATLQAKCKHLWLRALLALGYNYGFRKGELLGLRVFQVDLKARVNGREVGTIHLLPGTTKNDLGRTVVMTDEVHKLLAECIKDKNADDAVFTWPHGEPVEDFRGSWKALTKAAGLPGLLVHDLRRSAVRRMLRRGISKHTAKRMSGHVTDSIFDRYDITDEQDLAEAALKLEGSTDAAQSTTESNSHDSHERRIAGSNGHKMVTGDPKEKFSPVSS